MWGDGIGRRVKTSPIVTFGYSSTKAVTGYLKAFMCGANPHPHILFLKELSLIGKIPDSKSGRLRFESLSFCHAE